VGFLSYVLSLAAMARCVRKSLTGSGEGFSSVVFAAGIRILYSEWIWRSSWTAVQVRDHLKSFIDGNDMLLVVALTGEAAWTSLMVTTDRFKQSIAA